MESSPLVDYVLSPQLAFSINEDRVFQVTKDFPVSEPAPFSQQTPSPEQDNSFPSTASTPYEEERTPPTTTEWTSEAMVHSSLAANHMQQQHFDQALTSYQQALRMYRQDYLKGGVVDKCNAAATLHNMGLLHKKCRRYHQAIACLEEAEVLYRECSSQTQPQKKGDGVCLEYLLAETLQNRAKLHSKYHQDIPAAIDCQEEVVTMLLDLGYSPQQQLKKSPIAPKTPSSENVAYVCITDDQKVYLLSISLRSLGNLYLQQGEEEDALGAYQEALDMLRCRQSKFPDLNLQKKIASILLSMACVYFAQNELDQAVVALDECIAMHDGDQTHPDVITALNNLGLAYERKGNLDMAMQCYEDMLELRRRQLGENHVQVAEALITVAKMLERQGNMMDALERYQESLEIYRGALSNEDQSFGRNVAEVLSKISSLSNERGSVNDAISAYQQALTTRNAKTGETALDEAKVFVGLARSFSQKESFLAANDCLIEADQLLRSLPRDDERVVEMCLEITGLERSVKADLLKRRDGDVPLLLDGSSGNFKRVAEEIPDEVTTGFTLERVAEKVSTEVIAEGTREKVVVKLSDGVAGEEIQCNGEELAGYVAKISVELNDGRLLESPIASPEATREAIEPTQEEEANSPDNVPMLLLPSAASHESVAFGSSDHVECSPSARLLQQITVADETESAIELQCIVLKERKSTENTSLSTRSVTPELSLDEPSPPLLESFDDMQQSKESIETENADSRLKLTALKVLEACETSSIPEDGIGGTFDKTPSFLFGDELSLGSYSAMSVSSENAASSTGLNAYSSEHESTAQPMNIVESRTLVLVDTPSADKIINGVRLGESSHAIEVAAVEHVTTCIDAELESDALADEFDISNPNDPSPERDDSGYEYDSFGEGSTIETDSEDGESILSDCEDVNLDFNAENGEHTDGRENIYWDEDENREVQLTEIQDYIEDYPFGTPLGLKERGVSVLVNGNVDITRQSAEPCLLEETQFDPEQLSRASGKSSSPPSTPQKNLAQVANLKMSPRNRFVKALSRPFRRRSQLSHKLESTPEDEVANMNYRPSSRSQRHLEFSQTGFDDEYTSTEEFSGPLDFVRMRSASYDDSVSQITVYHDDFLSQRNGIDGQEWSWGLNIFADIAEDFLSAKSIHNRSRKDENNETYSTSSGEESDPFEDLSEKDTFETRTDAQSDEVKSLVGLSLSVAPDSGIQDDPTAPQLPRAASGFNVEGIVQEVNSTMWQPPTMLALAPKRRNGSHKIQIRIDSLEKSLQQQQVKLGYFHETVATSLVRLGLLRAEYGDSDIAIESILEALRIQKELRDPQAMARSLHFLADIYCQQEQYDLALRLYSDVQRIERRLFGPDHPDNANTLNKIGRAYANKGLFYQAMEKHQQALQVLKACVGENLSHPAVCETLIHIGEVYYRERNSLSTIRNNADDYKKFIETGMLDIIARAHEGRGSYKIALGFLEEKLQLIKNEKSDFPKDQLARLLYNVGTLSCKSGVFLEAIDYYEQALDIQMQRGCNDVDVATAKVLIGTVEFHIGQYRKSLNLLEGALMVFEKEFGLEHEVVADTLHRIGIVKAALWHLGDAMENLQRALNLQLKLFGENDLEVLQTRLEICWIEMNQGETDNVAAHVKGIMQKQQSMVGKSHPIVADTLLLLGKAYLLSGKSTKAVRAFQESFHMRERFVGRDHPLQAEAFHLIAIEGIRREKFQHSLEMCNTVLNIRRETLGERHLDVACALSSIGRCYAGAGKFVDAFQSFDDALQIAQESVGENHPCVGDIYVGKGTLYLRKCQFRAARESIDKGIEIYKTAEIHEHHDRMKAAAKLLEKVVRDEMLCV